MKRKTIRLNNKFNEIDYPFLISLSSQNEDISWFNYVLIDLPYENSKKKDIIELIKSHLRENYFLERVFDFPPINETEFFEVIYVYVDILKKTYQLITNFEDYDKIMTFDNVDTVFSIMGVSFLEYMENIK